MIHAFPKIFQLGDKYTQELLNVDSDTVVEVTEKIDGSQFVFGRHGYEIQTRSKGAIIQIGDCPKMFKEGYNYIHNLGEKIPNDMIFYCEYLQKPKHNVLSYNRVPKNNLILFAVSDLKGNFHTDINYYAKILDIESVPILYKGKYVTVEIVEGLLEKESILGGQKIEGVIVKNHAKDVMCGGMVLPIMSGKFVSSKFKEKHDKDWKKENTSRGKWDVYCSNFRSEARWLKAIQHLKDSGKLTGEAKDIGSLIVEIKRDIEEEEKENIVKHLWKEFSGELMRKSVAGFPEWYKEKLLKEHL